MGIPCFTMIGCKDQRNVDRMFDLSEKGSGYFKDEVGAGEGRISSPPHPSFLDIHHANIL